MKVTVVVVVSEQRQVVEWVGVRVVKVPALVV